MYTRGWKRKITIFSILLFFLAMNEGVVTHLLLTMLLIYALSFTMKGIAVEKNVCCRYKLSFAFSIAFSIVINITPNVFWFDFLIVLALVIGLFSLYRCCYPKMKVIKGWRQSLLDIILLLFAQIPDYFVREDDSILNRKKRSQYFIATIVAGGVFCIVIGLYSHADTNFAYLLQANIYRIKAYSGKLFLSTILGIFLAMEIYSFIRGLLLDILEVNPSIDYLNERIEPIQKTEREFLIHIVNPLSTCWILNVIIVGNTFFIITELLYYWNVFNFQNLTQNTLYYQKGYIGIIAGVLVSDIILYIIYKFAELIRPYIFKCRIKIFTVLCTDFIVLCFGGCRYFRILYAYGINSKRSIGLYVLIVMMIYLFSALYGALNQLWDSVVENCIRWSTIVCLVVGLFWNANVFPVYNTDIFLYKYKTMDLVNYQTGQEIGKVIISREDIDILDMSNANRFAIPSLVKLLDIQNYYEEKSSTVSTEVRKILENILQKDCNREELQQIEEAAGEERLKVVIELLDAKPEYAIGIRAYSIQSIKNYLGRTKET